MIAKLQTLYGVEELSEAGKIRLIMKVHADIRQAKYSKCSKPIQLSEVWYKYKLPTASQQNILVFHFMRFNSYLHYIYLPQVVHGAQVKLALDKSMPFEVRCFTKNGCIKYVYLLGKQETVAKFTDKTALEVVELYLGAFKAFRVPVPTPTEYFVDFLKYAILKIPIPTSTRYPKTGLTSYINSRYSVA